MIWSVVLTGDSASARRRVSEGPAGTERTVALAKANQAFDAADYGRARLLYENGLKLTGPHDVYDRTRFLLGLANCDLLTNQYASALSAYNDVLRLARANGFQKEELKAEVNRASVYRRMNNLRAAGEVIQQVEPMILKAGDPLSVGQAASVIRTIDFPRSVRLYRAALLESQVKSSEQTQAVLWNQLGYAYLEQDKLAEAEQALTQAFRLRVLLKSRQLPNTYFYLGWLKRKQGDFRTAVSLLERGLELTNQYGGSINGAFLQQELARACLGIGETGRALELFDRAVRSAGVLRLQLLPAESFRISGEVDMQKLFSEYIQAGMTEFERTGNERLAKRMFEVAEDSRTALFRSTLLQERQLPPEYLEKLAAYRRAVAGSLDSANTEAAASVGRLGLELADLEASLGIASADDSQQIVEKDTVGNPLLGVQTKLKDSEALLSFHTGKDGSFVWALTRTTFESHRLPGSEALTRHMESFRRALLERDPSARASGAVLTDELLGELSAKVLSREDWILSLDGGLFELPFAALPAGPEPASGYLGEHHSLRRAPTAMLNRGESVPELTRRFAALADPVYNGADPRAKHSGTIPVELPRLPGTGREAERCSRAWGADPMPVILTGAAVSRDAIQSVIKHRPAVLHIAAHMVVAPKPADQVMIALGLQNSGDADYLTPAEIATWRKPVGLITLSGCSSGTGTAFPGLGMFGLTRAWLLSGASVVVASHWPIPDDDGQLLSAMYAELGKVPGTFTALDVAQCLRTAQSRMRASGRWRSSPSYWAAFFVAGKD